MFSRRKNQFCLVLALLLCIGSAIVAAPNTARVATAAGLATSRSPEKLVTLAAENEPIRSVLMRLSTAARIGVAIGSGVTGYVTISLHGTSVRAALAAILSPLGDTFSVRDGTYVISSSSEIPNPSAALSETVLPVTTMPAARAERQIRDLFPDIVITSNKASNALIVNATQARIQEVRAVLQGIDDKNPLTETTTAIALHIVPATLVAGRLRKAFATCKFMVATPRQLLVTCPPLDNAQVSMAIAVLDSPISTPPPAQGSSEVVTVSQRQPTDIAHSISRQIPGLRVTVSGGAIVLSGPQDAVMRGKALIVALDVPDYDAKFLQIYRVRTIDASSMGDLITRSISNVDVTVEKDVNALAVMATASQQKRIADALAQLESSGAGGAIGGSTFGAGTVTELVTLKSAIPNASGSGDIVGTISSNLQSIAPDVKVIPLSATGQLVLVGSQASVRVAREFIGKIDTVPRQVTLDTEVYEIDGSVAKNLGIQLGTAILSTTYSEATPSPNIFGNTPAFDRLQALTRTPISFTAELNLAIQNGKGRVLANPRITTLSGRTASIKAGDNISILTTTAGSVGTIATTQVQSFQTGVTLDITPIIDDEDGITVYLHPVVNSLIGLNNGIPEISTRDTQTTVRLRDNETLVIGGLIQQNDTRTTTKLPLLGDLPLVGPLFRNENVNNSSNELVIVITPHILQTDAHAPRENSLPEAPRPVPLPTLPPGTQLPKLSQEPAASAIVRPPGPVGPVHTNNKNDAPRPLATALPSPAPTPSAFAQTNVFTFGSPPQSNFARESDPVSFFYASLSPTVVNSSTPIGISAITTSNVSSVKLQVGSQSIALSQTATGQWQTTFVFPTAAVSRGQSPLNLPLVATRSDGATTTMTIPVNVSQTRNQ